MYKNLIKISTIGMSREDWLAERQKSLGGSDVAGILGLNEYSSPYSVWADKLGKIPPVEENEAMRIGRDLEDYVAKRFTEATGKKVRRENAIIRNPDYPYLHSNVDRVVVGEDAVLECKTVSALNLKQYKNGEYPPRFYTQCCEYMLVCGFQKAYLAVLILGKEFIVFEIERDEDELAALNGACKDFWKYVEDDTPPATDGLESTTKAITAIYPQDNGETVSIMAYERDLQQYMNYTESIKHLEKCRDEVANKVKAFLGESARGESNNYKVTWTSASRQNFDAKRFAAEHPELDLSGYYKTSAYRTFKITENSK